MNRNPLQPGVIAFDPAHPLAAGLDAYFLPGRSMANLAAANQHGAATSATLAGTPGRAVGLSGPQMTTNDVFSLTLNTARPLANTSGYTYAILCQPRSANRVLWGEYSSASSQPNLTMSVVAPGNSVRVYRRSDAGVELTNVTASAAVLPGYHLIVLAVRGSSAEIWVDGKLDTAFTMNTTTISVDRIAFGASGSTTFRGEMVMAARWRIGLTASMIRRLNADPFAMLRPRRDTVIRRVIAMSGIAGPTDQGATLTQSADAAFPNRPRSGGVGLKVELVVGTAGQYLAKDLIEPRRRLFTRVLFNPATLSDGSVTLLRGVDESDDETLRVSYASSSRTITLSLAGGATLWGTLPQTLDWHCIECGIDADAGHAELWLNGRSIDDYDGDMDTLETRTMWIGATSKSVAAIGECYLDEWVIADAYIGPVRVEPVSEHADDPARWLVVYNAASADSIAWAQSYRAARAVPYSNLLGLSLPATEQVTQAQFESMRDAIADYLAFNGMNDIILGILLGHDVPGMYTRSDGAAEAIAGQLHRVDGLTTEISNPLAPLADEDELIRPTQANLAGHRLTARIDSPTLTQSIALTTRALNVAASVLNDEDGRLWLDPYGPTGSLYDLRREQMATWAGSIDRQLLRLPLVLSADSDPGVDVQFDEISGDAFFWGWEQATAPAGFFAEPAGRRVLSVQLSFNHATASTLRDAGDDNWAIAAVQAGYAAAGGSSRSYTASGVPRIGPFFEAMRNGWTLAEAWFAASPVLRCGLMLVGDPLMTVMTPRAGWNVYGPFATWTDVDTTIPTAALRSTERSIALAAADQLADGEQGLYLLRAIDAMGRSEAGFTAVSVQRIGDELAPLPTAPVWPVAPGWGAVQQGHAWRLTAAWADRFERMNVARVELVRQAMGEAPATVVWQVVDPHARAIELVDSPAHDVTRYRLRAVSSQEAAIESPWSAWLTLASDETRTIVHV
ncbi:MAG: hypothetical protein GC162_16875 [Planctomycetes bacterium]|nr:hypothetical protein [Planctomycetota bacterium]